MSFKSWFENLFKSVPPSPVDVRRIEIEFQLADGLMATQVVEGFAFEGFNGVWITSAETQFRHNIKEKFLNVRLFDAHNPNGHKCAINVNTIKSYRIVKDEPHMVVPSQ